MTDPFTHFQGVGDISEDWDGKHMCVLIEVDVFTNDSPWFITFINCKHVIHRTRKLKFNGTEIQCKSIGTVNEFIFLA